MKEQTKNNLIAKSLNLENIEKLIARKISAIHVDSFYPVDLCDSLSQAILKQKSDSKSFDKNIYESDVIPFFNTIDNPKAKEKYFSFANMWFKQSRSLIFPQISPSDFFRLKLEELWHKGVTVMRYEEKIMYFGITRIWNKGSKALPHQDLLRREIINDDYIQNQISQLGINIYLQTALLGGELNIWDYSFSDIETNELNIKGSYGYPKELLPKEYKIIKPKKGDLVIVNTENVHSISKIEEGIRITSSGFIGYWGKEEPLKIWS